MSDVVSLHTAQDPPDPDVVAFLESLLERARAGELRTIAVVGELTGRRVTRGFQGDWDDRYALVGHLTHLANVISLRIEEDLEA